MGRNRSQLDAELPSARRVAKVAPGPTSKLQHQDPLLGVQSTAGNRATVELLRKVQFALQVGAADDPFERQADAVARRVAATLARDATSGASNGTEGTEVESSAHVLSAIQRRVDTTAASVGAEGGPVDRDAEAQLGSARSEGAPLPRIQRARLEQAFGGADFSGVRIHQGPASAALNERFGARAFTVGSDVFFRGRAPDLSSRSGTELLAHELAHTVQQSPGAHRQIIRRDFVDTWDLVLAKLSANAQTGYSQFVTLNGDAAATKVREGAKEKDGANVGKYNTDRAEGIWSKKFMSPDKFDEALKKKQAQETKDLKAILHTMNHLCNETDGTHRPGSVGDGSSEWALKWETIFGEPFKSEGGHAQKLQDYCKVLTEDLNKLARTKSSVPPTETMLWVEKKGAAEVEVNVLAQAAKVEVRATERREKMREGLRRWNKRVADFPQAWNPDGTTKKIPPGERPEAGGKLTPDWPKLKVATIY